MIDRITVERDTRGVVTLKLNRPDRHNAFDDTMIADLTRELLAAQRDDTVRVVILTGEGKSFSSGADLNWMRSMEGYGEARNVEDALALAEMLATLNDLGKPTIAKVNGHFYGGGVGLVAACDIAIAADHARFALTEVRLGLVPAVISPYVIAAIGARHARRLFLTAVTMDTRGAVDIGLIHLAVPASDLDEQVESQVRMLLAGGPVALAACKALIADVTGAGDDAAADLRTRTAEIIARLRVSKEGQEGLRAFLEKRKPGWNQDDNQ